MESEEELEYLVEYIQEHRGASVDEIRFVHTGLVRKHEANRVGTKKQRCQIADYELEKTELMIRGTNIDWHRDKMLGKVIIDDKEF